MDIQTVIIVVLEAVTAGLLTVALSFARSLWSRVSGMEAELKEHRIEVERELADIRVNTAEKVALVSGRLATVEARKK
tara:strand:+ start:2632 stop:2865 length:234 start_codon:yes stop_codon:yes gene_type:complete